MSAASRFDDPLHALWSGNITPHTSECDMEGSIRPSKPGMFLFINRVPDKKRCASCNRGTRLQFERGLLKWRRCRRCLLPEEKVALDSMLKKGRDIYSKMGPRSEASQSCPKCGLPKDYCICGLELIGYRA